MEKEPEMSSASGSNNETTVKNVLLRNRLSEYYYGIHTNIDIESIVNSKPSRNPIITISSPTSEDSDTTVSTTQTELPTLNDEFIKLLVKYILQETRIFHCQKVDTWNDFYSENRSLVTEDGSVEYTCAELCDFFVKRVLPKIDKLKMPESWKKNFDLLRFNETFVRIGDGYVPSVLNLHKNSIQMPLIPEIDFKKCQVKDIDNEEQQQQSQQAEFNFQLEKDDNLLDRIDEFVLETQNPNPLPSQFIVVTGAGADPMFGRPQLRPRLSEENRALLSAVVSNRYELFHNAYIDQDEIVKRLKKSRALFQRTGQMSIDVKAGELKRKIKELTDLRLVMQELMKKRF